MCHICGRNVGLLGAFVQARRDRAHFAQFSGRDATARAQDAHLATYHIELDHWPSSARSQIEWQDGLASLIFLRVYHIRGYRYW